MRVDNIDYISLTDLARYKNPDNPGDVVIKWMSNKSSFDFYSLWEELFKLGNFPLLIRQITRIRIFRGLICTL